MTDTCGAGFHPAWPIVANDFRRWLTPDRFGQAYGLAQADIDAIRSWVESHGFTVNAVYPSRMLIDFSGHHSVRRSQTWIDAWRWRSFSHCELFYSGLHHRRRVELQHRDRLDQRL